MYQEIDKCIGRVAQRIEQCCDSELDNNDNSYISITAGCNEVQRARSSKDRAPVSLTGRCEFENNSKVSPRSHIVDNKEKENQANSLDKELVSLTGISHEFEYNSESAETRTLSYNYNKNYLKVSIARINECKVLTARCSGEGRTFSYRVRFPTRSHTWCILGNNSYLSLSLNDKYPDFSIYKPKFKPLSIWKLKEKQPV